MNKIQLSLAALLVGGSMVSANEVPVISAGGTKISMYGFAQLNAVYEDGVSGGDAGVPGAYHWTEIVAPNAEDGEGRFRFNINQTRIGFNLSGPQKEGAPEVSGRFETDFADGVAYNRNAVGTFRIRHAFGQVKFKDLGTTLLMGQSSDLIAPLSAPTLNQGGLRRQGSIGTRRPQIRLTQALGPVEAAVAVTDDQGANNPVMPGFQGALKGKLPAFWAGEKKNVELTLSGHYASEENAANTKAELDAKKADGWGTPASWSGVASLALPVIDIVDLSGEVFYGQNLNRYNNGSIGRSGRATGFTGDEGIQSLGGWGAATVKLPANLSFAGGMGLEAIDENRELKSRPATESSAAVNNPNKNMVVFANLKYNIASTAFVGFEYANLTTDFADKTDGTKVDSGSLNRFELVFNYAFR
ncbi:MAG: hypothetical protein LBU89_06035 [Fibromonadaceae bacterium]|jgi:hypothetical protein|nr:hypothetical protein [Fibromonadaceae bacterium]